MKLFRIVSLLFLGFAASTTITAEGNPYRLLVVTGREWHDPSCYLVENDGLFNDVVALLTTWGLPYDIIRLDQERLTPEYLAGYQGNANYSAVIWTTGSARLDSSSAALLTRFVLDMGVDLVALGPAIKDRTIAKIVGLEYLGTLVAGPGIYLDKYDELLEGFEVGKELNPDRPLADKPAVIVAKRREAQVLAYQGKSPAVSVKEIGPGTRAIWIGGDPRFTFRNYYSLRKVLKRALLSTMEPAVIKRYNRVVCLKLDDPGSAQNSFLDHWHYPTLSLKKIKDEMIEPLKKFRAKLVINVCPGFCDPRERKIVNPWTVKFTDPFGTFQDYSSTKAGLDLGLKQGVFEIQSHGWTHLVPDLDPGERKRVGWYREFYDYRREREIPAAVQRYHMIRSIREIEKQFGVHPLSFRPPGLGMSTSLKNHTMIIAAQVGFGIQAGWYYLGRDRVIDMSPVVGPSYAYLDQAEQIIPQLNQDDYPVLVGFHDKDVALEENYIERCLGKLGNDINYWGNDEICAYWHTKIERHPLADNSGYIFNLEYDPYYCRYFAGNPSTWDLYIGKKGADLAKLKVLVDNKQVKIRGRAEQGFVRITLPPGTGSRSIVLKF